MLYVGSYIDLCDDCFEKNSEEYHLEYAEDDGCPENPAFDPDEKSYHDRCSCDCQECGTGYRTTCSDCISRFWVVGRRIDIHRHILADVAIGLKKLDLPVLLVLEITSHLVERPRLSKVKEWEIAKFVKRGKIVVNYMRVLPLWMRFEAHREYQRLMTKKKNEIIIRRKVKEQLNRMSTIDTVTQALQQIEDDFQAAMNNLASRGPLTAPVYMANGSPSLVHHCVGSHGKFTDAVSGHMTTNPEFKSLRLQMYQRKRDVMQAFNTI